MAKRNGGRQTPTAAPPEPAHEEAPQQQQADNNRPVYSRRYPINGGESVEVAVFARTVENGNNPFTAYSTGVKRSFKEGDGEWKDSRFFPPHALPVVAFALTEAFRWISDERNGDR